MPRRAARSWVVVAAAVVSVLLLAVAAPAAEKPLYRGTVTVGPGGTGETMARFNGSPKKPGRYLLVIENGCSSKERTPAARDATPCPPPVGKLRVDLNGVVVYQSTSQVARKKVALPGSAVHARNNQLVLLANGPPGATARVSIIPGTS